MAYDGRSLFKEIGTDDRDRRVQHASTPQQGMNPIAQTAMNKGINMAVNKGSESLFASLGSEAAATGATTGASTGAGTAASAAIPAAAIAAETTAASTGAAAGTAALTGTAAAAGGTAASTAAAATPLIAAGMTNPVTIIPAIIGAGVLAYKASQAAKGDGTVQHSGPRSDSRETVAAPSQGGK